MKVKRSYPLTSVEEVEYKEAEDPTSFRLIFSTYIMILQAETADEAKDWVECINNGEIMQKLYYNNNIGSLSPHFTARLELYEGNKAI